jgi:hypothetical protein
MTRWVRFAGRAIYGTPVLMATMLMMVAAWAAAAEIYEFAMQIPGHGESAAMLLVGLNVVCSCLLVFNLVAVVGDVRELRLPQQRQLLAVGLIFICGFIFVLPCALVWALNGGAREVVMVAMGSVAGAAGALLWQLRSRTRYVLGARPGAAAVVSLIPAQRPRPWQAVRFALGAPYAPASWQRRVLGLALLCAIVALAPILVVLYKSSMSPHGFTILLHVAEIVSFLPAIALCWLWPLRRLVALFNPQSAALTELVLLPGLGGGRQQLRRLLLVAVSLPAVGLVGLLIIALSMVALEHPPQIGYTKVVVTFLLIPLLTLPGVFGQIAKPQGPQAPVAWFAGMNSQLWLCTYLTWIVPWDMAHRLPVGWLWVTAAVVLAALMVPIGMSVASLRKILRRPHPFVEV